MRGGRREGGRGEQTPPILKITTYKSLHSIDSPALHWNIFYSIWSTDNSIVVHHSMYHTIHSFVRCNCTAPHRSGRDCTDDGKLLREILPGGLTATEHRDWETELEKRQKRTMGPKDRFQHPWRHQDSQLWTNLTRRGGIVDSKENNELCWQVCILDLGKYSLWLWLGLSQIQVMTGHILSGALYFRHFPIRISCLTYTQASLFAMLRVLRYKCLRCCWKE